MAPPNTAPHGPTLPVGGHDAAPVATALEWMRQWNDGTNDGVGKIAGVPGAGDVMVPAVLRGGVSTAERDSVHVTVSVAVNPGMPVTDDPALPVKVAVQVPLPVPVLMLVTVPVGGSAPVNDNDAERVAPGVVLPVAPVDSAANTFSVPVEADPNVPVADEEAATVAIDGAVPVALDDSAPVAVDVAVPVKVDVAPPVVLGMAVPVAVDEAEHAADEFGVPVANADGAPVVDVSDVPVAIGEPVALVGDVLVTDDAAVPVTVVVAVPNILVVSGVVPTVNAALPVADDRGAPVGVGGVAPVAVGTAVPVTVVFVGVPDADDAAVPTNITPAPCLDEGGSVATAAAHRASTMDIAAICEWIGEWTHGGRRAAWRVRGSSWGHSSGQQVRRGKPRQGPSVARAVNLPWRRGQHALRRRRGDVRGNCGQPWCEGRNVLSGHNTYCIRGTGRGWGAAADSTIRTARGQGPRRESASLSVGITSTG